jgi:ribose transport system ATP-binding protein
MPTALPQDVGLGPDGQPQVGPETLVLSRIRKAYGGVQALRDATLVCQRGEIHALIGENGAGKSTLVKVLAGAVRPDAGEISLDGRPLQLRTPDDARKAGIGVVFQELSLIPDLNVALNLYYGIEPRTFGGRIDVRALRAKAREMIARLGLTHIGPERSVRDLSLAERQMVEILKVLIREPKVLILDEPTSALLPEQVQWLFKIARDVAERGGIVIFISHRLEEIQALSDRVTVFRGGQDVGHGLMSEMREEHLVELMLGRRVERYYPPAPAEDVSAHPIVCELGQFASPPRLRPLSMRIHQGEIVGIGGLQGQGQLDLFLALYGVRRSIGTLLVNGRRLRPRGPADALRAGIAFVPEDRASEGLCLSLSVRDNVALGNLHRISRFGLVNPREEQKLVRGIITALQIALRSPRQEASALSGGTQQKLLLGRVLATTPSLLLMYDATRGVDVGTKAEIFRLMRELCAQGVAILFYSTDASELANMSDRVWVLHDGTLRAELTGAEISEQNIIAAAVGGRVGSS